MATILQVSSGDAEGAKGALRRARKSYGLAGCMEDREEQVAACEARAGETASRLGARQEGLKCLSEAEIELAKAEGMAAGLHANPHAHFQTAFLCCTFLRDKGVEV